ncbi:MAG: hypothetical protein JXR78_13885 [Victivallales bacterium]|nr:hypothetical protein [Victivallales bacterium]
MSDYNFIFQRIHPQIKRQREIWKHCAAAYSGGRSYIDSALVKHVSEISLEFEERKQRAYYFNYPRKIARFISQFVLSEAPQRCDADAALVEDFSRTGLRTSEVIRQVSTLINTFGLAWIIVDMPPVDNELDLYSKRRQRIRPYAAALKPWSVVDWAYGADGRLDWAIVEEYSEDKSNPFGETSIIHSRRLWTRNDWKQFIRDPDSGQVKLASQAAHRLGHVPLIKCEEADGFGLNASHWFEDAVRISDAIMNAESEAQMNIIKQMFGLLVVSENFRNSDFDSSDSGNREKFSHVLARSAALWESPEEKGITRYISPGGAETQTIRSEIHHLKQELFDVVGLSIQSDISRQQTAESKAWDHHNVTQFLLSRVDMLEQAELKAWELMHAWDHSISIPSVSYNREFSVVDMESSIQALINLNQLDIGAEFKREISRAGVKMLEKIKKIPHAAREKIESEINAYGLSNNTGA